MINMDLRETGWMDLDWIHLVRIGTYSDLCTEPAGTIKYRKFTDWNSISPDSQALCSTELIRSDLVKRDK
jgi:hypothetical protein